MRQDSSAAQGVILVMGMTGSGKSYFINQLKPGAVEEGHNLTSCTIEAQIIDVNFEEKIVALVDFPGFDDTKRSETEILTSIAKFLSQLHCTKTKILGIIYLHKITDNRFTGASQRALDLFRGLVGEEALRNVSLVTTQWGLLEAGSEQMKLAYDREQELRDGFWRDMLDNNAEMYRFRGNRDSAEGIVSLLLGSKAVVLRLQRELVDEERTLGNTKAGASIAKVVEKLMNESAARLAELNTRLASDSGNAPRKRRDQTEKAKMQERLEQGKSDREKLNTPFGARIKEKLRTMDWQNVFRNCMSIGSFCFELAGMVFGVTGQGINF